MKSDFIQYQQDIRWLESLSNLPNQNYLLGIHDRQIFLARLRNFLILLGNPQSKLKFIHIAGTAGKGSTVGILHELMYSAGLKVGSHTSPYATTTIEKLKINEQFISPPQLHEIIEQKIKPALDQYAKKFAEDLPSYFEVFLAIGFIYFHQNNCDWVILEAGLGGMHDATNVISRPTVAAITNIGLDHMEILGQTKKAIALDKAGIIKPRSFFLTSEIDPLIKKLLLNQARQNQAKIVELKNLAINFAGGHYFKTKQQLRNLNLALNILRALKIKPKNAQAIINNFQLICRHEIMQTDPQVLLDGSHNNEKLGNLAAYLKTLHYNKLYLIIGLAEDKKYQRALKKLLLLTDHLLLTRFLVTFRKSADLRKLYNTSRKFKKLPTEIYYDPWQALNNALKLARKDDLIVITGSFFLTGELRQYWIKEDKILQSLKIH